MLKSVAIVNRKGGVGKTTLATILAEQSLIKGKMAICYDLDMQKNFTESMRYFSEGEDGAEYQGRIFIVGPDGEIEVPDDEDILMVIDCPPGIEEMAIKGIETAAKVIVPVMGDIYSMMNLEYVYRLVENTGKTRDDIILVTVGFGQERQGGKLAQELQKEFEARKYHVLDVPRNRMIPINIANGKKWLWGVGMEQRRPYFRLYEEINK